MNGDLSVHVLEKEKSAIDQESVDGKVGMSCSYLKLLKWKYARGPLDIQTNFKQSSYLRIVRLVYLFFFFYFALLKIATSIIFLTREIDT